MPARVARGAGYAVAALAYLTFLVVAGSDPGPVVDQPIETASQIEVAAHLP
jgi:hypothetical protein